ncbi:MAG TPA: hypothetical protein VFQ23_19290, partial [Anaerolineales bacterium]|nr:hypothetical protein [Anaerolineales bacterium]
DISTLLEEQDEKELYESGFGHSVCTGAIFLRGNRCISTVDLAGGVGGESGHFEPWYRSAL